MHPYLYADNVKQRWFDDVLEGVKSSVQLVRLNLLLANSVLCCFVLVCSGQNVFLTTVAPTLHGDVRSGVFAVNENVSFLQAPNNFLPTCIHVTGLSTLTLTLSKVNDGSIWAQEADVPNQIGRLVPLSPPLLQPNLTGVYECTAPTQRPSNEQYRLDVVGKNLSKFEHFLLLSNV